MVACMVPSMNARGKETRAGEKSNKKLQLFSFACLLLTMYESSPIYLRSKFYLWVGNTCFLSFLRTTT